MAFQVSLETITEPIMLTRMTTPVREEKRKTTCKSIDALAHKTALLIAGNPLENVRFKPFRLSGEEFPRMVTSSMLSFPS